MGRIPSLRVGGCSSSQAKFMIYFVRGSFDPATLKYPGGVVSSLSSRNRPPFLKRQGKFANLSGWHSRPA